MKLSFKMKIILPVLVSVLLSFVVSSLIIFTSVKKESVKVATQSAKNELEKHAGEISGDIRSSIHVAKTLANFATVTSASDSKMSRNEIMDFLVHVLSVNTSLYDAWIVWEPNQYHTDDSSLGEESFVYKDRFSPMAYRDGNSISKANTTIVDDNSGIDDWYYVPLKNGKFNIAKPTTYEIGGQNVTLITISVPFKKDGKIIGVAGVDMAISYFKELVNDIKFYESGYAFLLTGDFTVFAHPKKSEEGKSYKDVFPEAYKGSETLKNTILSKKIEGTSGKTLFAFHPFKIPETVFSLTMAMNVPVDEVFAFLEPIKLMTIIIVVISIAVISLIIFYIASKLVRTLGGEPDHVIELMSHISKGDFTRDIKVSANDNFSLVYSVKMMVNELRILLRQIIDNANSLRDTSTDLSSGANELSAGTISQSERSTQIASATAEMTQTTQEIAQNLSDISVYSSETADKATHSKETVHESTKGVLKIKDTVDASSALVQELSVSSEQIIEIVSVISDIADQTNLLALNAAIEAARAGDQGRGFAVVADEVRKLAERTQAATTEISELVNSTQKGIKNVTGSMSDVKINVDMGVKMTQQVAESLDIIVESVNSLEEMVSSISSATSQMASTSGQIQMDIDAVATVSEEITLTANHIAESSSNLEKMSDSMRELVKQFKI
jgi:methyl-accepting chemotaxis protein